MKIVDFRSGLDHEQIGNLLGETGEPRVESSVAAIVADVRERGDAALCGYSAKFDGFPLTPESMRVPASEIRDRLCRCGND